MNIDLLVVGKTDSAEIQSLVATYLKRLNFYTRVTLVTLPDLKNTRNISAESQKRQEGELLMRQFADGDYVVCWTKREPKCDRSSFRCGCKSG